MKSVDKKKSEYFYKIFKTSINSTENAEDGCIWWFFILVIE